MKKRFVCSLCRNGILGGALILDETALTYRTNKLTVDPKLKKLALPLERIVELRWKRLLFPLATFRMDDGEEYTFLIFCKKRFQKHFQAARKNQGAAL